MLLKINMSGDVPIYQQIRNQIVLGLATGKLSAGEKLPTVRQLADDIGVNPMTVNKAYALLKDEGVIIIDRRHGAKMNRLQIEENALNESFDEKIELLAAEALMKGVSKEELKSHISQLIDTIYNP